MNHSRNYSVKEIAALAGVSAGTVDRVIHNRGNVSDASREKVEKVLEKINYRPNLQVSSIGTKRQITLLAVLPTATSGYWEQLKSGIRSAQLELGHIDLRLRFLHYDQFDVFSCRSVYEDALAQSCDAMLIGPTFLDETAQFAAMLDSRGTPYVYVDAMIPGTDPLAFFGPDSTTLGQMQARLLMNEVEKGKEIVIMRARRRGDESSSNSLMRYNSFREYMRQRSPGTVVKECIYDVSDRAASEAAFDRLFAESAAGIGGIAVFNSRSYIIARYLKAKGIRDVKLVGYGMIDKNVNYLREGYISYLISERPDRQGRLALKAILEYIIYGHRHNTINCTPLDILISENVDNYLGSLE